MPHKPGHGTQRRTYEARGQDFGSNVVIGGNLGGVTLPSGGSSEEADKFIDRILGGKTREKTLATNILTGTDDKSDGQKDDGQKDDETFIQKIQNVLTGDEIKQLSPEQLAKAQQIIGQFQKLNVNPLQLRSVMISNLFGGVFGKDQTFTDLDGNTVDPANVIDVGDGRLQGLVGGEYVDVRRTREGVLDQLGSDTLQSLERFAPDLIFGTDIGVTPATSGGLLNLADNETATKNQDGTYTTADGRIISKEQGERYNNAVFAARAELDRMGKNPFTGTSNQGIMTASPALPGLPVTPPVTPPGTTPPVTPPIPAPIAGVTPFNINQFYASLPQYTQQGIMSPNLSQFYQNLGLFPGMNV